jgi:hypothetical protein
MVLRKLKAYSIYFIFIVHIVVPMLDKVTCADCLSGIPFQGKETLLCLQSASNDVRYSSREGQSKPSETADATSHCPICTNDLMGAEIYSLYPNHVITLLKSPRIIASLLDMSYPIDKPPQNQPA